MASRQRRCLRFRRVSPNATNPGQEFREPTVPEADVHGSDGISPAYLQTLSAYTESVQDDRPQIADNGSGSRQLDSLPPHRVVLRILLLAACGGLAGAIGMNIVAVSFWNDSASLVDLRRWAILWSFYATWCGLLAGTECFAAPFTRASRWLALVGMGGLSTLAVGGAMAGVRGAFDAGPQAAWLQLAKFLGALGAPSLAGAGMVAGVTIPFTFLGVARLELRGRRFARSTQLVAAFVGAAIGYGVFRTSSGLSVSIALDVEGSAFAASGTAAAACGMLLGEALEGRALAFLERPPIANA